MEDDANTTARLAKQHVDSKACHAAMRGDEVPEALGAPLMQFCLIRGMRYNPGFAGELRGATPAFARAWNARRIMSDDVPEIVLPEHVPYCIWHPEVASEATYRALHQRYPDMKYQVARACAVAGYTALYHELDVLPEVHVAEEARDNGRFEIFEAIMAGPQRFSVMNDYARTLEDPTPACLNGDTAVRSMLEYKRMIEMPLIYNLLDDDDDCDDRDEFTTVIDRFRPGYFNITEDGNIDTYNGHLTPLELKSSDPISHLLYAPLPRDLPPGNKDVLILMAAYYGDIDRYERLRRPVLIEKQAECIMHGIYHNTLFARWWANRLADGQDVNGLYRRLRESIEKAITARFIMNNDLSRISDPDLLPYCIWYPGCPSRETLLQLVHRHPEMRHQASRACIVAGYETVFDQLDPVPDKALLTEAKHASSSHFTEFLEAKIQRAGPDFEMEDSPYDSWKMLTRDQLSEPMMPSHTLWRAVDEQSVEASTLLPGIYEGFGVNTGPLELSVSARDAVLKDGEDSCDLLELYAVGIESDVA